MSERAFGVLVLAVVLALFTVTVWFILRTTSSSYALRQIRQWAEGLGFEVVSISRTPRDWGRYYRGPHTFLVELRGPEGGRRARLVFDGRSPPAVNWE